MALSTANKYAEEDNRGRLQTIRLAYDYATSNAIVRKLSSDSKDVLRVMLARLVEQFPTDYEPSVRRWCAILNVPFVPLKIEPYYEYHYEFTPHGAEDACSILYGLCWLYEDGDDGSRAVIGRMLRAYLHAECQALRRINWPPLAKRIMAARTRAS